MRSGTGPPPPAAPEDDSGAQTAVRTTFAIAHPPTPRLALSALLGAGAAAAAIGLIATSAWLISRASQRPSESALALAVVGVQFFALSRGLFRYAERIVGHDAAFRALADLRVGVYRRLESLAPAGLPAFRDGDLLARLVHDVDSLQDLLLRVIPPFAIAATVGALAAALVWWMLPAAGVILLVSLALAATLLPWITARLARRREARQAALRGELTAHVVDLVQGAAELAACGAVGAQLARTASIDAQLTQWQRATSRTAGVGQGLATVLSGLAMWGALVAGVAAVHTGRLAPVLLAVVALVPLAAFELVNTLPAATQALERVRHSAGRVAEVMDAPVPVRDPAVPRSLPAGPLALSIRGLRVHRGAGRPWTLDGLDLDLEPGARVAIVGPSGAGKSTLADVLLRFIPYHGGSARLGGVELAALAGDDVRQAVGLVAQDAHLFDTTLEENMRLARRDASPPQLRAALGQARLLEWTDSLPVGLATPVGEHGARLAGGQRQRLALARALLADFPLLVLDEPGEHLDTATADALVTDLLARTDHRALLLITHRLAPLTGVDEIVVLDGGRVRERGTHAQLIALDGHYTRMWARESGQPTPA